MISQFIIIFFSMVKHLNKYMTNNSLIISKLANYLLSKNASYSKCVDIMNSNHYVCVYIYINY